MSGVRLSDIGFSLALLIFAPLVKATLSVTTNPLVQTRLDETVTLQCSFSVSSNGARVTWEKNGEAIATLADCSRGSDITSCTSTILDLGKYSVDGDLSSGIDLVIRSVTLEDDGDYECKVIATEGFGKSAVHLTVSDPPLRIDMLDSESGESVANKTVYAVISARHELNCTVPTPSNPPPNITWYASDATIEQKTQVDSSAGHPLLKTSWRSVAIIPANNDGGKLITCSADHFGLPAPLRASATLSVGVLPERPSDVAVSKASTKEDSLVVTWQPGASGGPSQTYSVEYCPVDNEDDCSQAHDIVQTRYTMKNLNIFTIYRIKVKSRTVFGFSKNNDHVDSSTKPLSPEEMGVEGMYYKESNEVEIIVMSNTTNVPNELCFLLVYGDTAADYEEAVGGQCVGVEERIQIPNGRTNDGAYLVSYGKNVFSEPSELSTSSADSNGSTTGGTSETKVDEITVPSSAQEQLSISVNTIVIIGAAIGGIFLLVIAILAVVCFRKNNTGSSSASHTYNPKANRNLPKQPQTAPNPQANTDHYNDRYSCVKYQEVADPPGHSYESEMVDTGALYTMQDDQYPNVTVGGGGVGGGGQYYSRRINKGQGQVGVACPTEKYAYMEPMAP